MSLKIKLETAERERDDYMSRLTLTEKQMEKDAQLRTGGLENDFFID